MQHVLRVWRALTPRQMLVIVLFVSIFVMSMRETADSDMWWHLAAGRYITENHAIPQADIFSYTKQGTRWYMHEWLTEVLMYAVYRVGQLPALILVFAGVITLSFGMVYVQCESRPYLAAFFSLLGAVACAPLWGVRPQMINVLLMASLLLLLEFYRRGHSRLVWCLPLLSLIWCNMHAGFFLALGTIGVVLAGDGIALLFKLTSARTLSPKAWRHLLLALVLCVAATLLNPNGAYMLYYSFETLGSPTMQAYIQEWGSPNFHQIEFWPFAGLLLGGAALLVLARKRIEVTDLLFFFGFGFAGLLAMRHISLFAVVAPPIITRAFAEVKILPARGRNLPWLNWSMVVLAGLVVALRFTYIAQKNPVYEAEHFPVAALDYLRTEGLLDRRIFNTYNWGGYLIWHNVPVYIDGRADVYGDEFIWQYMLAFQLHGDWRVPLDAYHVDYILIEARSSFASVLEASSEWTQVYADNVSAVFVRK